MTRLLTFALVAGAVALTLFAAAAETLRPDEIADPSKGCTTIYQDGVADRGETVSYVTVTCPRSLR